MTQPFYFTWTPQNKASQFKLISADGTSFKTDKGQVWDLSSLSLHASFGQKPAPIIKRIQKQMEVAPIASPKSVFPLKTEVTKQLLNALKLKEGKIFYTVSGAEAVENALKIARQMSGKKIILARKVSYHGASLGALSVTGDWRNHPHATVQDWTVRIPEPSEDPDTKKTEAIILSQLDRGIAGLIVETVTGANGVYEAPQSWWDGIQKLCKQYKIFLIVDEVICGLHRLGTPAFGFHMYKVVPDMVVMAKNLSGGMVPLGALWTSASIARHYDDKMFACGLTYYAAPLGLAALQGVFDILKSPKFKSNLKKNIETFHTSLDDLSQCPAVRGIRTVGMMANIDLEKTLTWEEAMKAGVYLLSYDKRLVLAPALTYKSSDLKKAMNLLIERLYAL